MKDPAAADARSLRGAWYTPPALVDFLWRQVARPGVHSVLEPSCGDGVFLHRAPSGLQLQGVELEPQEAEKARGSGHLVHTGDFLEWASAQEPGRYDAAIGNPPYIRYQYLSPQQQDRAQAEFRRAGLPFTRHTNAWVPIVVASLRLIRPGGQLAMVLPAELLHVLHSQGLRDHLLRECSQVVVLDTERLWFPEALQGTVLLIAEKGKGPARLQIQACPGDAFLHRDLPTPSATGEDLLGIKWMPALLPPGARSLWDQLQAHPAVRPLGQRARAEVGMVTGANAFFLVPQAVVQEYALEPWAKPAFGRSEQAPGALFDAAQHQRNVAAGKPAWMLHFSEPLGPGARRWLAEGEAKGLHQRYKCRIRKPWWSLPSAWVAPVAMLKRSHSLHRLVWNQAGAYQTDTAYRLRPFEGESAPGLVASFVNSLTALGTELHGRHYGGGVLELVPSEISRLPSLNLDLDVSPADLLLRDEPDPERVLAQRDPRVLGAIGLSERDQETLREAWALLRRRRRKESP